MSGAAQAALRNRAVQAVLDGMTQAEAARVFRVHPNDCCARPVAPAGSGAVQADVPTVRPDREDDQLRGRSSDLEALHVIGGEVRKDSLLAHGLVVDIA